MLQIYWQMPEATKDSSRSTFSVKAHVIHLLSFKSKLLYFEDFGFCFLKKCFSNSLNDEFFTIEFSFFFFFRKQMVKYIKHSIKTIPIDVRDNLLFLNLNFVVWLSIFQCFSACCHEKSSPWCSAWLFRYSCEFFFFFFFFFFSVRW